MAESCRVLHEKRKGAEVTERENQGVPEIVSLPGLLNVQAWCILRNLVGFKWLVKGQVRKLGFGLFLPVVLPKGMIDAILKFLWIGKIEPHAHGRLPHGHRRAYLVAGSHLSCTEVTRCCATCILLHLLTDFGGLYGFLFGTLAVWINRFARWKRRAGYDLQDTVMLVY